MLLDVLETAQHLADGAAGLLELAEKATTQNSPVSGHKNDEEAGTASKNTNNQNNRTETYTMSTPTTGHVSPSNNNGSSTQTGSFDDRALNVAETGVRALEKVANEGVTLHQPKFKKRDAAGAAILGGVIGGVVGGAGCATAMALLPATRTNEDIVNAGGAGFSAGAMIGAGIGYFIGSREPQAPKAEEKK